MTKYMMMDSNWLAIRNRGEWWHEIPLELADEVIEIIKEYKRMKE